MKILDVETNGVRGLHDGAFRLCPPGGGGHLTVVTGPGGAGLTTLLDAVAYSAARLAVNGLAPDTEDVLRAGGRVAVIRGRFWLDADERAYGGVTEETLEAEVTFRRGSLGRADADPALLGLMSRYDHAPTTSKVVLIPARRVADGAIPMFSDFEADQRYRHLSSAPDRLVGLPVALARHAAGHGDRGRFDDARRLFDEISPASRLLGVSASGQLQFGVRTGGRVGLPQLGFAERNLFVLAALPAVMGLQRSIVLLDTPELGLPPGHAARCLDVLRAYANEAQWIVASRDPAVVAGAATVLELSRGGL